MENEKRAAVVADLDLDKIEALARAATPGEWKAKRQGVIVGGPFRHYTNGSAQSQIAAFSVTFHHEAPDDEPERQQANADFCAALNPAAALKLVALARSAAPALVECGNCFEGKTDFTHVCKTCNGSGKVAAQPPAKPEAAPQAGQQAHDGSEHPPKELRAHKGEVSVKHHNGTKQTAKVGAIDWHRVVTYAAPASLPDVAMPEPKFWFDASATVVKQHLIDDTYQAEILVCNHRFGDYTTPLFAAPAEGSALVAKVGCVKCPRDPNKRCDYCGYSFAAAPADLKLVPIEPTVEQLCVSLTFDASGCQMGEIYRAMVAAAPERSDTPAGLEGKFNV